MTGKKMVIAGGTGLIGRALATHAHQHGYEVIVLSRRQTSIGVGGTVVWDGRTAGPWQDALEDAQFVVNLCGASIGEGRWTAARKAEIRDSRLSTSRCLIEAVEAGGQRPKLLQASAIGFYGPGSETVDETSDAGNDYLSDLAVAWETEANAYSGPMVLARFGVVLDGSGGALPRMALPFRIFCGGKLGSGNQWFSWVTLDDAVRAILFALTESLNGPVNIVSPNPVTNGDLAHALGQALHRPALIPTPAWALRMLLGEQACLLLEGQRVMPSKLNTAGFAFAHPEIGEALETLLGR